MREEQKPAAVAVPGDESAGFQSWFQGEQGKPYHGMWEFARAAWMARAALAAAPQPPVAAQEPDEQREFESWLDSTRPSGDVELVQYQWANSSEYAEFRDAKAEWDRTHPAPQPAPAAQGDALIEFIERVGSVRIQRVREGFNGPIRWDVEYGYEDKEVRGRTLRDAINAAARAQAKEGGAA